MFLTGVLNRANGLASALELAAQVTSFPQGFPLAIHKRRGLGWESVIEPEQLDIFIPLQRKARFPEWARLARENQLDLADPASIPAVADWLRDNGRAPAGISQETLTVLVAVMREYVSPLPASAG
jgi:hypothetical protein